MTRLITCGYETGDLNEIAGNQYLFQSGTLSVVSSTPTPRAGGAYCLKSSLSTPNGSAAERYLFLPSPVSEVWVRCGVYFHPTSSTAREYSFIIFNDSVTSGRQVSITYSSIDSFIRIKRGADTGTLLATSSSTYSQDGWYLLDARWQATSTTTGTTEVWMNGVQIINFSGDNTNGASTVIDQVGFGGLCQTGNMPSGVYFAFDDIAINSTAGTVNNARIGDGRIILLKPNGAGTNTNQTRGGTDSGANWSQVDELPPSMTDYVYSITPGTVDTYTLEDLPTLTGSWSVNCVDAIAYGQNSDTGLGSLAPTIKSGSVTNEGVATSMSASAAYVHQLYETDPNTSAAWTLAAVNALEAGTTVR